MAAPPFLNDPSAAPWLTKWAASLIKWILSLVGTADGLGNFVPLPGQGTLPVTAANGFLYLPTINGTPTGTPTAYAGHVPIVYDIVGNRIWTYYGGAWRETPPGVYYSS
jgi:hypothetical protein